MTKPKKQAIINGGCAEMCDELPLIPVYILAQTNKPLPKVCLLPTASGDSHGIIKYFYSLYNQFPCETSHLSVFNLPECDIRKFLLEQDVIVVPGGNTKVLLGLWREYGIDVILKEAYNNGTIMSGGSAGMVCFATSCITDSFPGKLTPMDCTSILPFSACPHYSSRSRRDAYKDAITSKKLKAGYAADDDAALHFIDNKHYRSVSISEKANTFKVGLVKNKLQHIQLETLWLGDEKVQNELIWQANPFKSWNENASATETLDIKQEQIIPQLPEISSN